MVSLLLRRSPEHPQMAASSEREGGSMDPESFEDLGGDSDVFKNLPKISDEDVQEALKKQGVWLILKTLTWQGRLLRLRMLPKPVKSTMSS